MPVGNSASVATANNAKEQNVHGCDYVKINLRPREELSAFKSGIRARAWIDFNGDNYLDPGEEVAVNHKMYIGDRLRTDPQGIGFKINYATSVDFVTPAIREFDVEIVCSGQSVYRATWDIDSGASRDWLMGGLTFVR